MLPDQLNWLVALSKNTDGYFSLLKFMLHIYTEKFSLQKCYFYGESWVLCKKKDAHKNPSLPPDHLELGASLRRKKATCSEYQKIPKDPEGCALHQSKSEVPPLVFLVSFPFFFPLFFLILKFTISLMHHFLSGLPALVHYIIAFFFKKTCSYISSFFFISWSTMDSTMRVLLVLFDFSFPLSLPRDIQQIVS